jgi:hypothetical protein
MASKDEGGFLRVELRNFARTTRVSAEQVRREVALSNCPVTSWTVMSPGDVNKLSKDSFSVGELLELSARERMPGDVLWKEEPEKIGEVDADRMYGHVILPPHAFAPLWSAAEATDGSMRSVELELKARHPGILSVTNVGFFEAMLQDNTAAKGEPTQRLNQILVELREMRKELVPLIRSATFWFFLALGVLAFFIVWWNLHLVQVDADLNQVLSDAGSRSPAERDLACGDLLEELRSDGNFACKWTIVSGDQ